MVQSKLKQVLENHTLAEPERVYIVQSNDSSLIIFGTIKNAERLMGSEEWMMDVPSLYKQMVTIIGKKYNRRFSLIYVLIVNKTADSYETMWNEITKICCLNKIEINESPKIHLDFEMAMITSFNKIFPDGEVMHCLFHLGQSVFLKNSTAGTNARVP